MLHVLRWDAQLHSNNRQVLVVGRRENNKARRIVSAGRTLLFGHQSNLVEESFTELKLDQTVCKMGCCRVSQCGCSLRTGAIMSAVIILVISGLGTIHMSKKVHEHYRMVRVEQEEQPGMVKETAVKEQEAQGDVLDKVLDDVEKAYVERQEKIDGEVKSRRVKVGEGEAAPEDYGTYEEILLHEEKVARKHKKKEIKHAVVAVAYLSHLTSMITAVLFLVGVSKQCHCMMIPFIVNLVMNLVGLIIFSLIYLANIDPKQWERKDACKCGGFFVLLFAAAIWMTVAVVSYYRDVKEAALKTRAIEEEDYERPEDRVVVCVVDEKKIPLDEE